MRPAQPLRSRRRQTARPKDPATLATTRLHRLAHIPGARGISPPGPIRIKPETANGTEALIDVGAAQVFDPDLMRAASPQRDWSSIVSRGVARSSGHWPGARPGQAHPAKDAFADVNHGPPKGRLGETRRRAPTLSLALKPPYSHGRCVRRGRRATGRGGGHLLAFIDAPLAGWKPLTGHGARRSQPDSERIANPKRSRFPRDNPQGLGLCSAPVLRAARTAGPRRPSNLAQ